MAMVWKSGAAGGAMSLGAYWIAIWAMTQAPIASVAALRETSVLFAIAIATVVLKEKLTAWRLAAAVVISGGTVLLRI
jgi:drug/metabolite transporter (DMT)-like permease